MTGNANLVQQNTASQGTGPLTLSAASGFQTFAAAFGTGTTHDVFYYFANDTAGNTWEIGSGHMSDVATLVRDTVLHSSNGGALVNFGVGTKSVVNDLP